MTGPSSCSTFFTCCNASSSRYDAARKGVKDTSTQPRTILFLFYLIVLSIISISPHRLMRSTATSLLRHPEMRSALHSSPAGQQP